MDNCLTGMPKTRIALALVGARMFGCIQIVTTASTDIHVICGTTGASSIARLVCTAAGSKIKIGCALGQRRRLLMRST